MKKLICLMLAVMLAAAAGCLAESGDENEKTAFLQIKEGITAEVVRAAGDTEGIDTLKSGQFCGLIEETEHEGILWFHVFYLNSQRKGATGYIRAEEAEQLTSEKLKELMEDPDRANEILDLIDALNDYLNSGNAGSSAAGKEPAADGGNGSGTEGKAGKSRMEQLYKEVMDALTQVFNTDLSAEWEKAETAGKEAARKAAEAGQDMLDAVKDGAIDLFNKAKDAGEEALENAAEDAKELLGKLEDSLEKELEERPELKEQLDGLADGISDAVDSLTDGVSDAVESLTDGSVKEKLDDLMDTVTEQVKELTEGSGKEQMENLLNSVTDAVDSLKDGSGEKIRDLQESVGKAMDVLDQSLGKGAGSALDKLNALADDAREIMNSAEFDMAQNAVTGLADLFRDEGFSQGAETTANLIQLLLQIGME